MLRTACCCALYLLALPGACWAQAEESPGPRIATQEAYTECLDAYDRIDARKARWADRERQHQAMAKKFQAASDNLSAQVKQHAPTSKAELASYNRAVAARNASAATLNQAVQALRQEEGAINRDVFEANERCGGLVVPEEVVLAVQQQRKRRGPMP